MPIYRTSMPHPALIYLAAADYLYHRVVEDYSETNAQLHGLREAERTWRRREPHCPGPELEGIMASWAADTGLLHDSSAALAFEILFGHDHRWSIP